MQYYRDDQTRMNQIESRLKQWHAQLGDTSRPQIRSLTRVVNRICEENILIIIFLCRVLLVLPRVFSHTQQQQHSMHRN